MSLRVPSLVSCALFLAASLALPASAQQTGNEMAAENIGAALAQTPPMGWNSWNHFGCNVSEQLLRDSADALVSSGMRDAGYNFLVIDDCWHGERDAHGDIQADPKRFPAGIKALADYVHSKGLKFGIYSDAGDKTCAGRPGSRGHEYQDAAQYAAWGVDYLKFDWCHTGTQNAESSYATMRDALNRTGRPIVFSLCEWGSNKPWLWAGKGIGNLWRTTGDIADHWGATKDWSTGMIVIADLNEPLYSYAGPGHWNDPDMLEVGNGGMTADEYRTHLSLWAIMAAPLMAGNDIAHMTPETRAILTNKDLIAIDQDPLGRAGHRVKKTGDLEVWSRELKDGSRAVVLLNRGTSPVSIPFTFADVGLPEKLTMHAHELWTGRDLGALHGQFVAQAVPAHGVSVLRLEP